MTEQAALFSPPTIRGITIPNRIAVSPMCQYSGEDGFANDWHLVHLGSRAVGGAGAGIHGSHRCRGAGTDLPGDLGIWNDAHVEPLTRIPLSSNSRAPAGIQLAHAGRKASTAPSLGRRRGLTAEPGRLGAPSRPSPDPLPPRRFRLPHGALHGAQIASLVEAFAVRRAAAPAGLRGRRDPCAHRLPGARVPLAPGQQRPDRYGGYSRTALVLLREVTEASATSGRKTCPSSFRISATDWARRLDTPTTPSSWPGASGSRRRPDRLLLGRKIRPDGSALPSWTGVPGSIHRKDTPRERNSDCRSGHDHRPAAGGRTHSFGSGGPCFNRA